jgi:ubiquinone/menaquinone biosynthesis C-methylase UbiE
MTTESTQVRPEAIAEQASSAVYAIGTNPAEQARLRRQADELRPHSLALLDHVGVEVGCNALDLGCGPRGSLELLSERVGPTGHVTGLDFDPEHVTQARAVTADQGLTNVAVVQGDARRTGFPSGAFDLVHARLLLVTIPDPAKVVTEMVRLVRPGGWVVGDEADCSTHLCYPPNAAWDRLAETFIASFRLDGADPDLGRRLSELYRAAGLVDVTVEARADMYPIGHSRRTVRLDILQNMRSKIVERGLLTEREFDELNREARAHLADPNTLVVSCLYFLARGRKPNDEEVR